MTNYDELDIIESENTAGAKFEVVQYKALKGSADLAVAEKVFFCNQANVRLKMVRVTLDKSELIIEPGALYFMRGSLQLESGVKGGIAKGLMRKFMTGETLFQSRIKGTGEVFLEPTFGHYMIVNLDDDALIFDKSAFYCASSSMEVSAVMQKNVSSALFGGEGLFQTQVKGTGVVVLNSPVPASELLTYQLETGEKLSVDGNFAFARTSTVQFAAEKSGKTLFQSVTSAEGLLQTFTGPGIVWIAPTQGVYDKIALEHGIAQLSASQGSMGTKT